MKGQVSTELIVIVGVVFLIFIPLLVFVYTKADEAQREMVAYQGEIASSRLAYLINAVGSLGVGTTTYTEVYLPPGTQSLCIKNIGNGGEVSLKMMSASGERDFVEILKYKTVAGASGDGCIIKNPTQGWTRFKISSYSQGDQGNVAVKIEKS